MTSNPEYCGCDHSIGWKCDKHKPGATPTPNPDLLALADWLHDRNRETGQTRYLTAANLIRTLSAPVPEALADIALNADLIVYSLHRPVLATTLRSLGRDNMQTRQAHDEMLVRLTDAERERDRLQAELNKLRKDNG